MSQTIALVVAAGRGSRLGADRPKQYLNLAGAPILRHTLRALAAHPGIDGVRAVIHPDDGEAYANAASGLNLMAPVHGGASRQQSVLNGLESLVDAGPTRVLIHDGARPFVEAATIDRVLQALETHAGAIPAIAVSDTLKRTAADGTIAETVPRAGLWRAQTPQGFRYADILTAHRAAQGEADASDDAAVLERTGQTVALVQGSPENVKVTTQDDLTRAERWLAGAMETRVGQGFDVHRFADTPGPVMLCGLPIDHDVGLAGHSDADVGLHVVVDALLGALGEGDIGHHFPPSDPTWKGADSAQFVTHALEIARTRGARLVHVDVTLICERPKVGPHRDAMAARIADLLELPTARVSVKATTTEGLGFTGRREGIAAQAAVTVQLPEEA
ncbi:bifunctional 2-C-methyl-D-erythritol 4-phosphate cytidylyltransferase/2-C-methyl-D-erythritol 2,4-cyclodiphosphate synthase [Rhodovibrio salinarum]|uniref:Bifunctional enzyme IspD/IspF n=1 Tax=Rhodovibrio salinarum TaxID=1087 RepID=A0A934QJ78_9PROT|nr:bifunctional 2-C-methyl-D-erythritol 4-phosphate cytidylyltransferase/2-C-methyl-D-erythritol 2,4-cyclodiphosphate synthase [Rhodovibrio salinarum]MBK1697852.1 bifunctional 2-C-methyl-D-erythritol 4-phosphate cytidylyltransferase/2-C-methyl-D-erythritol 2,4-cyclodiphosphate synthase [Rhodovibrio salinarum]